MSFGFSVGDFLAVIGLVTQLRKDFLDAPSQLRDLSAELKTFSIVLQDTEVDLTANELDSRQLEALESTLNSAREFLKDLQQFIENNKEIPKSTSSRAKVNLKRIWKRLNFDQREVSKFRHQITSIISGLQMFTLNEVKHNTRKIARYVDKQEHRDILKWLSDDDFNYHKNYQRHLVRNRQPGTRKWLLGSDEWKSWLEVSGQILYCPGIPGSGKTFTTAMVIENIENLSEEHGWVFAYIFCNYQQRKENMCEKLLRSLLRMVLEQTQEIPDEVQRWPTRNKEISINDIIGQLRVSMKGCSRVFFMVDALDELDVFQDLVSHLFDLQEAVSVNLYFTSRKLPHIQMHFDKAITVPIKATEYDVEVYLDNQMGRPHVPNFVRSNQALQDEIKKTVVNAVGEMRVNSRPDSFAILYMLTQFRFLLADLQVTQLIQSKSTRRLQNALRAISSGTATYESTYEAAMDRIQSQDERQHELATNAISILAYAERPLLAPELVHALSVDLDFDEHSDIELDKIEDLQSMSESLGVFDPDLMPTVEDVLAASAGLIVHQPDSDIIQLVHKTTKEYLMSDDGRQKWFPRAQFTIASTCLIYSQASEERGDAADWPFLDYAQKHYGHHIMAQRTLERSEEPATAKLDNEESGLDSNLAALKSQRLLDQIGLARMAQELGGLEGVLVAACEKNQLNIARVLLSTNQYNQPSGQSAESDTKSLYAEADCAIDRALLVAVRNGHLELVDLLLKHGASPMTGEKNQYFPGVQAVSLLAIASFEGHQDIVAYLLEHDHFTMAMMEHEQDILDPDAVRPYFHARSPICLAAKSGEASCVKTLWQWIEIEIKASGRYEERERILQAVTLSALSGSHDNVLQLLPRLSDTSIASILGDLGQPSLLSAAIYMGCDRYTTGDFLLRAYNSDLSVRDASGANALILASKWGLRELDTGGMTRRILEEREYLLNSQDFSGRTSLSWAAGNVLASTEVLLGHENIQVELEDVEGFAPIDYLMRQTPDPSHGKILSLMVPILEHGINRVDRHGCTLLHSLIDVSYVLKDADWLPQNEHWAKLEHYEGRKMFERQEEWGFAIAEAHSLQHYRLQHGLDPDYPSYKAMALYISELGVSGFRQVLGTKSVSAAEIRSSPCKCGIGTIFLAISTERVRIVEALLDFYPDLVNDKSFDGSSPLDLANCIRDQGRRQSMIDLILSKNPIVETCKADTETVGISESDSVEAHEGCSFTDLRLQRRRGDHAKDETGDQ